MNVFMKIVKTSIHASRRDQRLSLIDVAPTPPPEPTRMEQSKATLNTISLKIRTRASAYQDPASTYFTKGSEIVDLGGLGSPGGLGNLPKRWGSGAPHFIKGFPRPSALDHAPRGPNVAKPGTRHTTPSLSVPYTVFGVSGSRPAYAN